MKTSISVLAALLMIVGVANAAGDGPPDGTANPTINVGNQVDTDQFQSVSVIGGGDSSSSAQGGDASSDSIAASRVTTTPEPPLPPAAPDRTAISNAVKARRASPSDAVAR